MSYLSDDDLKRLDQTHPERGSCPTCEGKGFYRWKGSRRLDCNCREQKRLSTLYSHAGIGLLYQRLTWHDLGSGEGLDAANKYLLDVDAYVQRGLGLYLWGEMGTGKTLVANLVLKELIKKEYDCYATTFAQTIEEFTRTWGDNAEKQRFADRFIRSRVLLLDDLGKEFRNRLPAPTLDYILRTRVQEARPTILTTNLPPSEIPSYYGAGVLSLLVEQSVEVHLTGEDFRPKARVRNLDEIDAGETRPIS